jgi:hypothetical protein
MGYNLKREKFLMSTSDDEFEVLNKILAALQPLTPDQRRRIVRSLTSLLSVAQEGAVYENQNDSSQISTTHRVPYSADLSISPKQFLLQKQPRTDVERIACLAFYLTHYRDAPHFKTLDLAKLNTEAAQPKFSNTAYAATNAAKMGYLAPAPKGQRQISAAGEPRKSARRKRR